MQFIRPKTLPEAIDALAQNPTGAKVIAGGMAMTMLLQQEKIAPETLVSLARVPGLDRISATGDGLRLGPLALLADIAASPPVRARCPVLAQACAGVGNVRVRNQATLGGNLAEADYATDPPAALLCLDAVVTATGPAGARQVPLADFFPGAFRTVLEPAELITGIWIPPIAPTARMAYLKYKSHSALERPCVGIAAAAEFEGEVCLRLSLAVGAACEVPRRLAPVEALAQGQVLSDTLIAEIAEAYAAGIETVEDIRGSAWYRRQMIRVHVRRALQEVRDGRR